MLLQMEEKGLILIFQCGRVEVGCRVSDLIQPLKFCLKTESVIGRNNFITLEK